MTDSIPAPLPHPPAAAQVAAVLDSLAGRLRHPVAAALHLTLPADSRIGGDVVCDRRRWTWRGITVEEPATTDSVELAEWAAELVRVGARDGDRWLDIDAGPAGWVKPTASGTRTLAVGTEVLCGTIVAAGRGVPVGAVVSAATAALDGKVVLPALLPDGDGGWCLCDGDDRLWQLHGTSAPAGSADSGQGDPASCAAWLAETLGGSVTRIEVLGARVPGTVDVDIRLRLGGFDAVVPATLGAHSEMVGVPASHCTPSDPPVEGVLPAGFDHYGSCFDPGTVVLHRASGIRVRLLELGS